MSTAAPDPPEILSKTATSLSIELPSISNVKKYKVAYSEYGFLYYTWIEEETSARSYILKGLEPNTCYVCKLSVFYRDGTEWSEYSECTPYIRTFTEEEAAKRSGTYYEHALLMEREQTAKMQHQISKLTLLLNNTSTEDDPHDNTLSRSTVVEAQDDLFTNRVAKDATIAKLQHELQENAITLKSMQVQKTTHEKLIQDLIREGEELKQKKTEKAVMRQHEAKMKELTQQQAEYETNMQSYQVSLEKTRLEIKEKEEEVERIMQDCRLVVQEHADNAQAKQLQMEYALQEAKESLEQQVNTNELLRNELAQLGPEYQQSLETIQRLSTENARLREALENK